ncbi:MAG: GNAT family N-acetyltransferase [Pseudomonadota bacterium]
MTRQTSQSPIVYAVDMPPSIVTALSNLIGAYGFRLRSYSSVSRFTETIRRKLHNVSCILVSLDTNSADGIEQLRALRAEAAAAPIVVMLDRVDGAKRKAAIDAGATDVVESQLMSAYLANRLLAQLDVEPSREALTGWRTIASGRTALCFRALEPEDASLEQEFVRSLSKRSRYLRFFSTLKELSPKTLYEFTHTEFPGSHALVATVETAGGEEFVGVARYATTDTPGVAEFAVVVADEWQGRGIAGQLLRGLTAIAAVGGVERLCGLVLKENTRMLRLARALGFEVSAYPRDSGVWAVTRSLAGRRSVAHGPEEAGEHSVEGDCSRGPRANSGSRQDRSAQWPGPRNIRDWFTPVGEP